MTVAVVGSGAGALAVAADLSRAGHDPVITDLPAFAGNLQTIHERRGVRIVSGFYGLRTESVRVVSSIGDAIAEAAFVIVVVPCFGHVPVTQALAPHLRKGQSILFFGEGSGSIVAWQELSRLGIRGIGLGETNTLPYLARLAGPGAVAAERKAGGVLFAGLPASDTENLLRQIIEVWPYITPAESVWETILVNYNAIDHVPTMLANVGTLESRTGRMLLWGEGATQSVVRAIEAVDGELLAIRRALGLRDTRRYAEFLVEEGLVARDAEGDLYALLHASRLATAVVSTGPDALSSRFITEDVPYALVLASSIGDEVGVDTPVIDGLVALASVMLKRSFKAEGRTLASLGLAGRGMDGLRRFATKPDAL